MKQLSITLLFLCCNLLAEAQGYFSVMAWNVENAFDTIHDEGKQDEDFLPEGKNHWTRYRFFKKLREIGKTIVAIDSICPIDVVGLCEVENDTVLTCLTERTQLRKLGYRYVMTHSQDERGIDVALLYAPMRFRLTSYESLRTNTSSPVRDVLHATGIIPQGDTLDIYMVHLPSQLGGAEADKNRRDIILRILNHTDSVSHVRPNAHTIIMGDFNYELRGKRLRPFINRGFTDVIAERRPGTYRYQGTWSTLDHILIRLAMSTNHISYSIESGIAALPFLLEPDKTNGGQKPCRTYYGPRYNGGISDHLPVWIKLKVEAKK